MKNKIGLFCCLLCVVKFSVARQMYPLPAELEQKLSQIQTCYESEKYNCDADYREGLRAAMSYNDSFYLNFYRRSTYIVARDVSSDSAVLFAQRYLGEAEKYKSVDHQLQAIHLLAMKYSHLSKYDESTKILKVGMQLASKNELHTELVRLKNRLSGVYRSTGEFEKAEKEAFAALDIASKHEDIKGQASAYLTLGSIFGVNAMYTKSLDYSLKACSILRSTDDTAAYIVSCINAANAAMSSEMLDTAENLLTQAITLLRNRRDPYTMAGALIQQARVRYFNEDFEGTIASLEEALTIAEANGNRKQIAYIESTLGKTYSNLKQGEKAIKHSRRAYEINKTYGLTDETLSILTTLASAYELIGDDKQAFKYFKIQTQLEDSLYATAKTQQLLELEKDYENKIAEQKLISLKKDAQLKKWKNTGAIALVSMLALYALLLVRKQRLKMRTNKLISEQKEQLHRQNLQKQRLEKERLEHELEKSKRQLISKALKISENNELLNELEQQLKMDKSADNTTSAKVLRTLKNSRNHEKDWASFIEVFESVHPQYISRIKQINNELTTNDIRLCSLEKMNFGTKQIAAILHISDEGVRKARYRLKKKLGVNNEIQISQYLQGI